MSQDLLLEIGVEEIPPQQLSDLAEQLRDAASVTFKRERLSHRNILVYYTPRRLALYIEGLAERQGDTIQEIKGPPKKVAFDERGKPTAAALGFCRSRGARPEALIVKVLPEGEYCFLQEHLPGRPTAEVLSALLPQIISQLTPRETMRWDDSGLRFIRPIRGLLCLFGDEPVSFSYGRLRAGRVTRGHRTLGASELQIKEPSDYLKQLADNGVILDPAERRSVIETALHATSQEIKAHPVINAYLLDEIANNLEHPSPVLGRYPDEFLSLPSEILATTLVEHQKFVPFAVGSKASPYFVGFRDGGPDDGTVRTGYERVVRARLTDSQFFFSLDRQTTLVERTRTLRSVVYHEKLGSLWDKVTRMRRLAQLIGERASLGSGELIDRAAFLCKADLLTTIVGEFPSLQGVMGGIYAKLESEPEEVARAIGEHYRPRTADDALPETPMGVAISLADKLDTLISALLAGEEATGSRDPLSLRRAANGIIRIALERSLELDFYELTRQSEDLYHFISDRRPVSVIEDFLSERLYQLLLQQYGVAYDILDAVVATRDGRFAQVLQKTRALEAIRSEERFRSLVIAFARVCNITRDQSVGSGFVPRLFTEEAERELWRAYLKSEGQIKKLLPSSDYAAIITQLVELREPIDRYFDDVLVMAPEREIRQSRLGFLNAIVSLFMTVGDLSKIVVEGQGKRDANRPR